MRIPAVVLVLVATAAWAGEKYIGTILVNDAGYANNATTGYGVAGCAATVKECSIAQAFRVPASAKVTIQCNDIAYIQVNSGGTDAGIGTKVAVDEKYPTSTGPAATTRLVDGGSYTGGLISIAPAAGATTATCKVSERSGTE